VFFVHPLHREERFFVVTPRPKAGKLCCNKTFLTVSSKAKTTIELLTGFSDSFGEIETNKLDNRGFSVLGIWGCLNLGRKR